MNPVALVASALDHYVKQLVAFAASQSEICARGSPEVKLRLGDHSTLFERLYCVDFLKNDGNTEVVELQADTVISFDPVGGTFGLATVTIEHVRWADVVVYHDAAELSPKDLADWFEQWFDPNDKRHNPGARLSGVIHSLLVEPGAISVDLGSATADAFWDMLGLLERVGAKTIRVSSSRADAAP
jgi:hypothetical protein